MYSIVLRNTDDKGLCSVQLRINDLAETNYVTIGRVDRSIAEILSENNLASWLIPAQEVV